MNKIKSQSGQAIILLAFAIVGLVGFGALAIDGGRVLSDKRHAQNAADTAAFAAALSKIQGGNLTAMTTAARNRALSNGYDDATTLQDVVVNNPPASGPYAGNSEYIQVIITSRVNTTFARVIGRPQVTNTVQAVARATSSTTSTSGGGTGYGITSLKPSGTGLNFTGSGDVYIQGSAAANAAFATTGSGTYDITGNVTISGVLNNTGSKNWNVGGNVWVNGFNGTGSGNWNVTGYFFSNQNFSVTGSGDVIAGSLTVVGSATKVGSATVSPWPAASGTAQTPPVVTDPFASILNPPANPGGCTAANFVGSTDHTINPGCYTGISMTGSGDLTLNPGIYYVTGNVSMTGSGNFTANGVMIYMQSGSFNLTGSGDLHISPIASGPYKGLSLYMDRNNSNAVSMTGSGASTFIGTVYAPASAYTTTGSGGTFVLDSQVICYTSTLTGSGDLSLIYNPANNFDPAPPTPPTIELIQ